MLNAGLAKININPPLEVPHGGWGAQTHRFAEGYEYDFFATALVLAHGDDICAIVDLDLPMLAMEENAKIRTAISEATGIPESGIRISTSHTHAGPDIWGSYYDSEALAAAAAYRERVSEACVTAVGQARETMEPVRLYAGYGSSDVGKNRRQRLDNGRMIVGYNPDGLADPTVTVLRLERASGDTFATVSFYSCHPTTLGYPNRLFSPDYPGAMKRVVETTLGGTGLFMLGCAGDNGPGPEGFLANVAAMRRIGTALGAEVVRVSAELEAASFAHEFQEVVESGASLGIWSSRKVEPAARLVVDRFFVELPLYLRQTLEQAQRDFDANMAELQRLSAEGASPEAVREYTYKVKRANIVLEMTKKYTGMAVSALEVQILIVGDAAIIGVPLEPFAAIGVEIRERSPFPVTVFTGYTNGWIGYLPNESDYPFGGYEVEHYPYAPEAARCMIEAVVARLGRLYE